MGILQNKNGAETASAKKKDEVVIEVKDVKKNFAPTRIRQLRLRSAS